MLNIKHPARALILAAILTNAASADSIVYACRDVKGRQTYSQLPCAVTDVTRKLKVSEPVAAPVRTPAEQDAAQGVRTAPVTTWTSEGPPPARKVAPS